MNNLRSSLVAALFAIPFAGIPVRGTAVWRPSSVEQDSQAAPRQVHTYLRLYYISVPTHFALRPSPCAAVRHDLVDSILRGIRAIWV